MESQKMKYLNAEQIKQAVIKAAEEKDTYYMIIKVLSEAGLRVSELINLTPQNINFIEGYFHIKGKGGHIRNVDISRELCMQLQMYIKNKKIKPRDKIFDISRQRVQQITSHVAGINPHGLRHSYAIALLRTTGNIRYLQKQLGHRSLSTTQVYLQFVEYDKEKEKLISLYA